MLELELPHDCLGVVVVVRTASCLDVRVRPASCLDVTEFCVTTASIRLGVRVTTTSCLDGRIATAGVSCSGVVIRTDSCLCVRADSCLGVG